MRVRTRCFLCALRVGLAEDVNLAGAARKGSEGMALDDFFSQFYLFSSQFYSWGATTGALKKGMKSSLRNCCAPRVRLR